MIYFLALLIWLRASLGQFDLFYPPISQDVWPEMPLSSAPRSELLQMAWVPAIFVRIGVLVVVIVDKSNLFFDHGPDFSIAHIEAANELLDCTEGGIS